MIQLYRLHFTHEAGEFRLELPELNIGEGEYDTNRLAFLGLNYGW